MTTLPDGVFTSRIMFGNIPEINGIEYVKPYWGRLAVRDSMDKTLGNLSTELEDMVYHKNGIYT